VVELLTLGGRLKLRCRAVRDPVLIGCEVAAQKVSIVARSFDLGANATNDTQNQGAERRRRRRKKKKEEEKKKAKGGNAKLVKLGGGGLFFLGG